MEYDIEQEKILLKAKIFIESNDYSNACKLIEIYIENLQRDLSIDERNTFTISFHNLINEKFANAYKYSQENAIVYKENNLT